MFPPDFCIPVGKDGKDHLCIFCEKGIDEIEYAPGKKANRKETEREYLQYLKLVAERAETLTKGEEKIKIVR
jgi:hypothetical protein